MRSLSSASGSIVDTKRAARRAVVGAALALPWALAVRSARAGAQQYEPLADAVRSALAARIADTKPPQRKFDRIEDRVAFVNWLAEMSQRLSSKEPEYRNRVDLLRTLDYECTRAGLDRQMVLGLIQVESGFRRYAISPAGARGYMQVMPFWAGLIGDGDQRRLFDMRTNLRYGCVILRHYLDGEQGDLFRALGRYNGSVGRPEYPQAVLAAWRGQWNYIPRASQSE
ncbi:MAG: lytic transglycosylase domain-containing protein [Betaproteobacteria bacterium]|jgi:soluble lytic murein transglycosylase-like protein|nr:MAG: lytic transglycosylase domain-containing protein [Betaproteobacteria bacterium]